MMIKPPFLARQLGVSLIEVMIAMLLISIMAATLLPLHQQRLRNSRDDRALETAMRLAESKLDELRQFAKLKQWQLLASGEEETEIGQVSFTVNWTTHAYQWQPESHSWLAAVAIQQQGNKHQLAVTVTWQNSMEQPQSFNLQAAVVVMPTLNTGPFGRRF
ncbi:type IV pilus modification PilV family protein [Oceanisphaera avium]|uniref:Prepilin-type cleavage/methylation domain-containing protein n=1 Tax=Oceanisphaera avium TaxID=1903694 RepID=A0A1Y0CYZ9_9GAMM|nr:type II secretion system protein [Oceanisphaera avium]ART80055.1 hypothetical protein CBP12_07775 [Oceanisphaera avium]